MEIEKNKEIQIEISSLAFGGKGIARVNDFVVFVDGALPGQTVIARICKIKKSFAEARLSEVIHQSPLAQQPRCSHFGDCGGCQIQHLRYEEQLKYKRQHVQDCLERIGKVFCEEIDPTLPSENIYYYRNKMEYSFSTRQWIPRSQFEKGAKQSNTQLCLGLHARGRFDAVLNIDKCFLLSERGNDILNVVREMARTSRLPAYSNRSHQGFWRICVIREGKNTDETMINIVTSRFEEAIEELAAVLVAKFPTIKSIINTINPTQSDVAYGEKQELLHGSYSIQERLGRLTFEISANSFFQTNPLQAARLFSKVVEFAEFSGDEIVYDLFCGTGSISMFVASHAKKVYGFELVEDAIRDAKMNCRRNGIANCEFIAGDIKNSLTNVTENLQPHEKPEIIIFDPPRNGVPNKTLKEVLDLYPQKILYISCNPATLARDLQLLCEEKYNIKRMLPVDMFPHTWHVEALTLLTAKNKS